MHRATGSFSTLESLNTNMENSHIKMQSRSFPELHDTKGSTDDGSRFVKMPVKTAIPVR